MESEVQLVIGDVHRETRRAGNSRTVALNSAWYGFEVLMGLISAFFVSVLVARTLGPQQVGYYVYISWLTNTGSLVASLGIPMSTRKYMAEYLGQSRGDCARAVFFATLRLQIALAIATTGVALALVFTASDPTYRPVSTLLVLGLLPKMILSIPSQANMAAEKMRANVPGSLLNNLIAISSVSLSLLLGWNLLGISAGMLLANWAELTVRMIPVVRWITRFRPGVMEPKLPKRMLSFSAYGLVLLLLNTILWDKSDIVVLRLLTTDIRQLTFFAVAFNIVDKVLLLPQIFGHAFGASLMAQVGRDQDRLPMMAIRCARYLWLCSIPLLLGAGALSSSLIHGLYGKAYSPAIPVLAIVAVFAISRSMLLPAQQLLLATEHQGILVLWVCLSGLLNVALDVVLIRQYGVIGAALANGVAQTIAMAGIWVCAIRCFNIQVKLRDFIKVLISGATMSAVVGVMTRAFEPWLAIPIGVALGVLVFACMLRLLGVINMEDSELLLQFRLLLPVAIQAPVERAVGLLLVRPTNETAATKAG